MKLSVVILNYNVRYFLELCLKSVQKALADIDSEIIVIDNDSKDDSCSMVKTLFPQVQLIENTENVGFAKANNQAVKYTNGEYLCILNPDTVVAEDTFLKLLDFSDSKENLGIVGCKLIDGTGKYLPESKRNIPKVGVALKKMLGSDTSYYANHLKEDEIGEADVLVGAFMLLKRSVYKAVNGFDEDYFMYGEDIDISYRLLKLGYKNFYFGETMVIHYKGESTLKDQKYAQRFYHAMQLFYEKHFSKNGIFNLMVWFGLKLAFLIRKSPKLNKKKPSHYIFVSKQELEKLDHKLGMTINVSEEVKGFTADSEIIFNANNFSYKKIIAELNKLQGFGNLSFKILPKDANFVIGSDDSINRGEVITF